MFEFINVQSV